MDASGWEIVRLAVVVVLMAALFWQTQRRGHSENTDGNIRTIKDLNITVNTLARQLDEAVNRVHLLELDNQALKAENKALNERIKDVEEKNAVMKVLLPAVPLAVVVGSDPQLFDRDRVALRRAGIAFRRLAHATQALILAEVRRRRQAGDAPPWWLISAHAGPEGVLLADGIAPPEFWHEVLEDVKIVILAACSASTTADLLAGLVDTVIWFQEAVGVQDAADFNYALFRRLVVGKTIDTAYAEAVREVPAVAEFVDLRHT